MSDWPPRWDGPNFKQPGEVRKAGRRRGKARVMREIAAKQLVRREDRYCRFPLCGCDRARLPWEVAHLHHKGMGGNPRGDRSDPGLMIYLCSARHRDAPISLHAGTLWILSLTDAGTRGPCAFYIRQGDQSFEVGRETALHEFEPFTPEQRRVLTELATSLAA